MPAPGTGPIRILTGDGEDGDAVDDAFDFDEDSQTDASPRPEGTPAEHEAAADLPEPTLAPPPTRQVAPGPGAAPPALPVLDPLPEPPDGGVWHSARYTIAFARGYWQRRVAARQLHDQNRADTTAFDGLLGALGRTVRALKLNNRSLAAENQAIDEAEARRSQAEVDSDELSRRLDDENQRFTEQEQDRENKLAEAEAALDKADKELDELEAQRRSLREKRKTVERQQRAYIKTAEEREAEAARATGDDDRAQLRRAAEDLRREAAALDPERQDLDRRLAALEKPVSQAAARVEALRGEQESIRRALRDLREGHRHRLSEFEAEQGRKGREATTAEAEIGRRLVTLGTLLNLNRIERPEFDELYARLDGLRGAIVAREKEIDRLISERGSYDRGALVRGGAALLFGFLALATAVVVVIALL
ncbi:MAG TPA: hypothetical protein VKB80_06640 [Kofleriaceae bacterium]|nr:hypothetical protein [Kofleriaceae bacterium]